MAIMEKAGVKKLSIKEKTGFELHLERHDEASAAHPPIVASYPFYSGAPLYPTKEGEPHHARREAPAALGAKEEAGEAKSKKAEDGKFVLSPMVGTFYSSPSPDDPPFAKTGDRVEEGTVLCIIEAMKVMNEVKAGTSGILSEVLVENAHPVEFGTKLFRIV